MLICSSPVSTSSFHLPDPILPSSSLLAHFATPPFSVLPLPPPHQDELYAFEELPPLLQGISSLLDDQVRRRISASSLDHRSSRGSQTSESMSASESLRHSVSSSASSSLRSASQGSLTQATSLASIFTKDTEDEASLEIAKEIDRVSRHSQEKPPASLLDRLRPLSRSNTLSSQQLRKGRQGRRERGSDVSSAASSIRVVVQREQVTTIQRIERDATEDCQSLASQTAAWRMMQGDCRADQVFCDINSILRHAPFATSCVSPTSPSYRHRDHMPSTPASLKPDIPHNSPNHPRSEPKDDRARRGYSIGSLITRLRSRKGRQGSRASSVSAHLQSALLAGLASEGELAQASRILGLSWGCAARQVWESDCYNHSWRMPTLDLASIAGPSSVVADEVDGWTLERDDGHLQHWTSFYDAYSQGQLDLSVTPRLPKGVPLFDCCPMATPAGPGGLTAPTPQWELLRARAYCRLELHRLEEQTLTLIAEKVASCLLALHVQQSVLHCLEGDAVLRLTASGLQAEEERREQSLCAHAILNRNRGMVVQDLEKDWRFEKPERRDAYDQLKYYAGMPIVAGSGLPVAVLSVCDGQRDFSVEPTFLKRTARDIGQIFEEHHRKRWETKICRMTKSVELLQRRLSEGIDAPWGDSEGGQSALKHTSGWSATHDYDHLQDLATLGVLVTLEDSNRLQCMLREMASLLDMEMMYIAAVHLMSEGDKSFTQQILPLARHNIAANILSPQFHRMLFASRTELDEVDIDKRFFLRQNDCEFADHFCRQAELQPLQGTSDKLEAMLILPIVDRGPVGFVLGALTRSKKKIIGVEDLRYMEALRPSLCLAIDQYHLAHQSAHFTPANRRNVDSYFDAALDESFEMVLT